MALSTQDINLVKRKVFNYLKGGTRGDVFAFQVFDQLFRYFSQHGANPDLQVVFFDNLGADAVVADAACKVYGIYIKKGATGTDSYYKLFDDAATDSSADDAKLALGLLTASERQSWANINGLAFAAGVVHGCFTAIAGAAGTTASTSGDGASGFIIIGAA